MNNCQTGTATFGPLDANALPLFTITPGFSAEDALAHLSVLLKGAEACAFELTECPGDTAHGLALSLAQQIDTARGLVQALLNSQTS